MMSDRWCTKTENCIFYRSKAYSMLPLFILLGAAWLPKFPNIWVMWHKIDTLGLYLKTLSSDYDFIIKFTIDFA